MIIFSDFILQIIAISAGSGSLITLIYLNFVFPRSRRLRLAAAIVMTCTINYLIGILTYAYAENHSVSHAISILLLCLQLFSGFAAFYCTFLFIGILGHPNFPVFRFLGRILYVVLFIAEIIQVFFNPGWQPFSDFLAYLFFIFLWAYLLSIDVQAPIAKKVQISGLIGFGILIPLLLVQRYLFPDFPVHFVDAGIYLFITISGMIFSVSFLVHRKQDVLKQVSTIDLQKEFHLTEREAEVMDLLVKSYSYKEIAFRLGITMPTVKTHASRVYRKTGSQGKTALRYLVLKKNGSVIQKSS
jgi:DNA-binding CsgD family transcriptional regulator